MMEQWDPQIPSGPVWHERREPKPLSFRRVLAFLMLWLALTGLGAFHVYLRFLTRQVQLERRLLVKRQTELLKRQMELESELALARRALAEQQEQVKALLGLVEASPHQRKEVEVPRQLVAKYLPQVPKTTIESGSALINSAQAAQVEVPPLVQAIVSVIEANRAQGARPQDKQVK